MINLAKRFTAAILLLLQLHPGYAQCTGTPLFMSFDTVLTSSGNGYHTLQFPRFNAHLGTLAEVRVQSMITLSYGFNLENREAIARNYSVRVNREDEIWGEQILTPLQNAVQRSYGPYALAAYDGIPGSGTDYTSQGPMYVLNNYAINRTLSNTADFLGTGNIEVNYAGITYSSVLGSITYNFNGNASDTIRFTLTYVYCPAAILAADLVSFTAKRSANHVALNWITANEEDGRTYEVQRSFDGKTFTSIQQVKSKLNNGQPSRYHYNYNEQPRNGNKVFYRIRQIDRDGSSSYSALQFVEFDKTESVQHALLPNPSRGDARLVFHNVKRGDWKVEVLTMNGQMLKTYQFKNALQARIDLRNIAGSGTYILKATDLNSGNRFVEKMIVY